MSPSSPVPKRSILVKGSLPAGGSSFALDGANYESRPLFESIGRTGYGVDTAPQWHIVSSPDLDASHLWDVCHRLRGQGFGIAGTAAPEFAEPNLLQQWPFAPAAPTAHFAVDGSGNPENPSYPTLPDNLWYTDAGHAGFGNAAESGDGVRIAHLDTGYDPGHQSVPKHLNALLQRNFVDGGTPDDATDRTSPSLLSNVGHGTGTLSILAGQPIPGAAIPAPGGATDAEIVPIRVANSVVLFENSAIAQALDYVHKLCSAPGGATWVDIVTMSMGGLASQAWADAVNALYDIGVFIVTAAGNNFGNLPTHNLIFPARFRRVVAACGVMADSHPYANLDMKLMAGNYGPPSRMDSAIAAYTPNIPWARIGSATIVDWNGNGTSSATPQIAAAAARWVQKYRAELNAYGQPWMKVEAIRAGLFAAGRAKDQATFFGNGTLDVPDALAQAPAPANALKPQPLDSASFPLLQVLLGLGMAAPDPVAQRMLELEALQLSQSWAVEQVLPDPEQTASLTYAQTRTIADALLSSKHASIALQQALAPVAGPPVFSVPDLPSFSSPALDRLHLANAVAPPLPKPESRALRIFAYDPSLESDLKTLDVTDTVTHVRWEQLEPGPVGEYLEVVDVDPASNACYAPVDLDAPALLAQNGLRPAEGDPQFHQQMAYAVSMKTIEHFEDALGRVALWAPRKSSGPKQGEHYVQRLRIYPHALLGANAYYSPERAAILLGYFSSTAADGTSIPNSTVYAACSYDIVAHETTHALLDGLHRRYGEATNLDMPAFHEGFADVVALFQHFTVYQIVRSQLARTRGDLRSENLLGDLAAQFGIAKSGRGALRMYLGHFDADGKWLPAKPSRGDYSSATEPHTRGAVLVAAIFDAFLRIYGERYDDLVRLATAGAGILPQGNLPAPLLDALAKEATKLAGQWLKICIRALDLCGPNYVTFGDYLRALITADADVAPADRRSYRLAFIEAFRDRGIYAEGVRTPSVTTLVWEPPPPGVLPSLSDALQNISLSWDLHVGRYAAFKQSRDNARAFHTWLMSASVSDDDIDALGLIRLGIGQTKKMTLLEEPGTLHGLEVHSVRPSRRVTLDGQSRIDVVVEITQTWHPDKASLPVHRGGVTLIIDPEAKAPRYIVGNRVAKPERYAAQLEFAANASDRALRGNYFSHETEREPFALLHREMVLAQESR